MSKDSMSKDFKNSLKVYNPDPQEAYTYYSKYIFSQAKQFEAMLNFLCRKFEQLKLEGKISEHPKFIARIKSPESALTNHASSTIKKLDDCFGITFIGADEEELEILEQILSEYTITTREKNTNHNTHPVKHTYCFIKSNVVDEINNFENTTYDKDTFPLVEMQFKTIAQDREDNFGKSAHWIYKNINPSTIQYKYDHNMFRAGYDIPTMYEYINGHSKVKLLNYNQTLKKLYPFLNTFKHTQKKSLDNTPNI